jgi:hypothetical protein
MKTVHVGIYLASLAVLFSCQGIRQAANALGELQKVQTAVGKAAGTDAVNVNLNNGKFLRIGIINSALGDLPADDKKAKVLELAKVAYKSYPKSAELEQVSIAFVTQKSYAGLVNFTDTSEVGNFKPSELTEP